MIATETTLKRIWEGCKQHNRKQQELLYQLLAPRMLTACLRYIADRDEAQDVMQEGFIKVFSAMHKYRGEGSLEGWIRRIMVHSAISRHRKQKLVVLADELPEGMHTQMTYNNNNLEAKDLLHLIQQLPDTYRNVFNLYAIEGYSHQEIGNVLGISELVSRTTLCRARGVLKDKLSGLQAREKHRLAS
ncbi:sigma-70 family RNA polymerase sigma factor [Mucilaginibacter robiniae]|uniref:Sigma-70 family RNA polymerase sigma factor n=1 Tax=Mucilaginibacter robiniae TaxID=2728022 RepID=A0A7L5E5J5_9SPHI|nr:sigma-70 family RNA polymerase sigma factor [Mucilaginibacter robiniae]QJD95616.1 sigma-70 family RNA polymerase sigma factor [Mucilaginibacter robiniae]